MASPVAGRLLPPHTPCLAPSTAITIIFRGCCLAVWVIPSLVWLSLAAMEVGELVCFSANELAFLFFLQAGAPLYYGLRPGTRWCDVMGMLGAGQVAAKLQALSWVSYPPQRITQVMAYLREHTKSTGTSHRSGFIDGSLVWILPGVAVTDTARPDGTRMVLSTTVWGVGGTMPM